MPITNYDNCKNATEIKTKIRSKILGEIAEFLKEKYGEENVSQVDVSEISVAVGEVTLSNGEVPEICVNLKPSVKEWEYRKTEKKEFFAYERLVEEDSYKMRMNEKAKKEKERKAKPTANPSKMEKQRVLEEREKELDEIAKKVREKREKEVAELKARAKES